MKTLKGLFLAFALISTALFTTSCEEEIISMDRTYSTGIHEYNSDLYLSDLSKITTFFSSKGFSSTIMVTGKSTSNCDALAIAEFNAIIETIEYSEVEALGLDSSTEFSFQLKTPVSTTTGESEVLARFDYPTES